MGNPRKYRIGSIGREVFPIRVVPDRVYLKTLCSGYRHLNPGLGQAGYCPIRNRPYIIQVKSETGMDKPNIGKYYQKQRTGQADIFMSNQGQRTGQAIYFQVKSETGQNRSDISMLNQKQNRTGRILPSQIRNRTGQAGYFQVKSETEQDRPDSKAKSNQRYIGQDKPDIANPNQKQNRTGRIFPSQIRKTKQDRQIRQ